MKSFRRSLKGISPIFATLILIAIAVIAGVVVYMFTSGTLATMTGGGTAAQEKVSVQAASIVTVASPGSDTMTIYAQSTNSLDVVVNSAVIKDAGGNTIGTATILGGPITANGGLTPLTGSLAYTGTNPITKGSAYTITLVSAKGGSFVSSTTIAS